MENDVFCKILRGEIATEFVYKDDEVAVFNDVHPKAPVHLLVVPVQHFTGIKDFKDDDQKLLGRMLRVAHQVAGEQGLVKGYRVIINEGEHAGKEVPHLHMHILGGRPLGPKIVSE